MAINDARKETLITTVIFCEPAREKPCVSFQQNFVTMDKFITFIGYVQNYVVPSRRNGSTERAGDTSARRKHAKSKDHLPQDETRARPKLNIRRNYANSGSNSNNGGPSGEEMGEADVPTEQDGKLLRGEVEEARCPRLKTFVQKEQAKRFAEEIDSCRSQAVLPPVKAASTSSSNAAHIANNGAKAAQRETSAASPEKLNQSAAVNKQTHFLRPTAAQELSPGTSTRQKQSQNRDHQGNRDLPDIFSTEGKPLVQVKQRLIPGYVPAKRTTTCLLADNLSVEHVTEDWIPPESDDKKSRLKLPKLKKKFKKKKKEVSDTKFGDKETKVERLHSA